jgi:hypothetical protein
MNSRFSAENRVTFCTVVHSVGRTAWWPAVSDGPWVAEPGASREVVQAAQQVAESGAPFGVAATAASSAEVLAVRPEVGRSVQRAAEPAVPFDAAEELAASPVEELDV